LTSDEQIHLGSFRRYALHYLFLSAIIIHRLPRKAGPDIIAGFEVRQSETIRSADLFPRQSSASALIDSRLNPYREEGSL